MGGNKMGFNNIKTAYGTIRSDVKVFRQNQTE